MDKPDWKDAPEWAQWLAQDKDADWYWWEDKPLVLRHPFWMPGDLDSAKKFKLAKRGILLGEIVVDWASKLETRP